MQKQVWTDEKGYWFLNILTTHPDSQGKGIGGALVRHVTKMVPPPLTLLGGFHLTLVGRPMKVDIAVILRVASLRRMWLFMNVLDSALSKK
jgi:GNAT superfamily N-acetyltransferase